MPIYEYVCTACGHDLEALQKIADQPLIYCPQCGEETLKKKISAAAFQLKGTGWYETDFKNSGKKKEADSPTKKKKSNGDKTAGKPAEKAKTDSGSGKGNSTT